MRAALSRGFFSGFSFTLLRDPVERVLSQYSFSRQIAIRGQPDSIRVQTYALEELMKRSAGFGGSFWNAQTFALSSLPMDETSPDRNLASALVNLERFDFVGTTETLTADAPEIARLLNGNPDALLLRENQTPHRLERK
jgi:hypothetical protein